MLAAESSYNPWKKQDEMVHPHSAMEWWAVEAFFKTKDDVQYSVKVALNNWQTKAGQIGTNFVFTLFNQNKETVISFDHRDDTQRIKSEKQGFHISFNKQKITGSFPQYKMTFMDEQHDIILELAMTATVYPRWVAQQATNGWLPIGLGFYRYGFIPKCTLNGTLSIKGEQTSISGTGYFEHVWGNFTYHRSGAEFGGLKKTIQTYARLTGAWMHQNKPRIPDSIGFATENNPLGYDWAWAVFDNGWTLFYGNILFWIMQGPVAGSLIVTKDGQHYDELFNVHFEYVKTKKADKFSFEYPTCFRLHAHHGKEHWDLCFTMQKPIREYTVSFHKQRYWKGLVICEAPGVVEGTYTNEKQSIPLKGICKIEPQRQVSAAGHNKAMFRFIKPPQGIGVELNLESEVLQKKGYLRLECIPRPRCHASLTDFIE